MNKEELSRKVQPGHLVTAELLVPDSILERSEIREHYIKGRLGEILGGEIIAKAGMQEVPSSSFYGTRFTTFSAEIYVFTEKELVSLLDDAMHGRLPTSIGKEAA